LAIYSLSINPTTGAAERNWSIHGYIHSKARNRLANEKVQKLVYLFQNLRVRDKILTSDASYFLDAEVEEASDDEGDENEPTEDDADWMMKVEEDSDDDQEFTLLDLD
jgi:hypothetical protein